MVNMSRILLMKLWVVGVVNVFIKCCSCFACFRVLKGNTGQYLRIVLIKSSANIWQENVWLQWVVFILLSFWCLLPSLVTDWAQTQTSSNSCSYCVKNVENSLYMRTTIYYSNRRIVKLKHFVIPCNTGWANQKSLIYQCNIAINYLVVQIFQHFMRHPNR